MGTQARSCVGGGGHTFISAINHSGCVLAGSASQQLFLGLGPRDPSLGHEATGPCTSAGQAHSWIVSTSLTHGTVKEASSCDETGTGRDTERRGAGLSPKLSCCTAGRSETRPRVLLGYLKPSQAYRVVGQ